MVEQGSFIFVGSVPFVLWVTRTKITLRLLLIYRMKPVLPATLSGWSGFSRLDAIPFPLMAT
ncbi:MAG: hypothetical protein VR71_23535 [Roseovarius sp. BRH_c41]|nr:MAG: hypothetical protein VR71_23535 [Roseovarius sp. BRH_c41]